METSFKFPKLDVDNYGTWSIDMKNLLAYKGWYSAIDEDEEKVDPLMDRQARALIGLCVADHIKPTLTSCDSAAEVWSQLEDAYKAKSNARRLALKRELANLKMASNEELTKYVARGRAIMNQLLAAGHEIEEEELVASLLAGLPKAYYSMVDVLRGGESELTLEAAIPKLQLVEQRLVESGETTLGGQDIGVNAYYAGRVAGVCWHCQKPGHMKRNCPELKKNKKHATALGAYACEIAF